MKKITDYIIIENSFGDEKFITIEVNKKIKKGWQPYGQLCSVENMGGTISLYQPMVKYELIIPKSVTQESNNLDDEAD